MRILIIPAAEGPGSCWGVGRAGGYPARGYGGRVRTDPCGNGLPGAVLGPGMGNWRQPQNTEPLPPAPIGRWQWESSTKTSRNPLPCPAEGCGWVLLSSCIGRPQACKSCGWCHSPVAGSAFNANLTSATFDFDRMLKTSRHSAKKAYDLKRLTIGS